MKERAMGRVWVSSLARAVLAIALLQPAAARALTPEAGSRGVLFGEEDQPGRSSGEKKEKPTPPRAESKPESRLQVPDAATQATAEKTIKEIFKSAYAKRAPADQQALANNLLQHGIKTEDDAVSRYVLLREARDLASAAGDVQTGMAAINAMAKHYAIDLLDAQIAFLASAVRAVYAPSAAKELAEISLKISRDALAADDYGSAVKAASHAETMAQKCKDAAFLESVRARAREAQQLQKEFQRVKAAAQKLKAMPDDPESNLALGKFLCFVKGDWEKGLLLLSKGSDEGLKTLALVDMDSPERAGRKMEVGDAWWDLGEKETGNAKGRLQARAVHWYELALPDLSGLNKTRLEKRIAEAKDPLRSEKTGKPPLAAGEGEAILTPVIANLELRAAARFPAAPRAYTINGKLTVAKSAPDVLNITVEPGAEIRGGTIELGQKGHLIVAGTPQKPAILRNVHIVQDLGAGMMAKYAVFDQCTFTKGGAWFTSHSSKWQFDSSLLFKSKFSRLTEVDYGFQWTDCAFIGMTFPEIEGGRHKNVMNLLRKEWDKIEACSFIDCTVPPTVFWCAETSNFLVCKFIEGEAFESNQPTEVQAYVAQTLGDAPHRVYAAKPAVDAPLKIVYAERLFPSYRFPVRIPIPELREGSRYGQLYVPKQK